MDKYTKWVACWGNATSITDRREAVYAKDITLRYPIRVVFGGDMLRLRFSNLTGTEPVTLSKVIVAKTAEGGEPRQNKAVKRNVNVAASTNLGFGGHDACVVFKKI